LSMDRRSAIGGGEGPPCQQRLFGGDPRREARNRAALRRQFAPTATSGVPTMAPWEKARHERDPEAFRLRAGGRPRRPRHRRHARSARPAARSPRPAFRRRSARR
jgi:hypothetical protein